MLSALPQIVMTLAGLSAMAAIVSTMARYGAQALELRQELEGCRDTMELRWSVVTHSAVRPAVHHRITPAKRPSAPLRMGAVRAAA